MSSSRRGNAIAVRDLWDGADVRWAGPETTRQGVLLRPGARAVVTDAGRHRVTSFGSLYSPVVGPRPARPGRGVRVRLASGEEVRVPRKHLEITPPDHPLSPEPDGAHAAWWLEQLAPWGERHLSVSSLIPASLPAVCQVLHPWWGAAAEPISWTTAASRLGFASVTDFGRSREMFSIPAAGEAGLSTSCGELDAEVARALVDNLAAATTTPDNVFVAVWGGWGDVPPQRFPGAAHLPTANRGHFLLRGPLVGVLSSVAASSIDRPAAGLWWPADRAWFVATEIEFEWTFVAGAPTLIEGLYADGRLEVAPASFDADATRVADPR